MAPATTSQPAADWIALFQLKMHRRIGTQTVSMPPVISITRPLSHRAHWPRHVECIQNVSCLNCMRTHPNDICVASATDDDIVVSIRSLPKRLTYVGSGRVCVLFYFVFISSLSFSLYVRFCAALRSARTRIAQPVTHKTEIHSKHSFSHRTVGKEWGSLSV